MRHYIKFFWLIELEMWLAATFLQWSMDFYAELGSRIQMIYVNKQLDEWLGQGGGEGERRKQNGIDL